MGRIAQTPSKTPLDEAPPSVPSAAWLEYFANRDDADRLRRRAMSGEEVAELRHALSKTSYVPGRALWLGFGIFTALLAGQRLHEPNLFGSVHATLLVVGSIAIGLLVGQRVHSLRLLRQDLATRSLEIIAYGASRRQSGLPAVLEYLPRSGRAWSIDQRPAPWRQRGARR